MATPKTGIADYSESTLRDSTFKIVCSDACDTEGKDLSTWNWCEVAKSKRLFIWETTTIFTLALCTR
jgi:hypothetical protein